MMKALCRYIVLGALLFAASRWFTPAQSAHPLRVDLDERRTTEGILLAEAMARGLGDDDIVVQRRLVETARSIGEPTTAADAYRDALRLGIDRGDPIIHQRLVQQMRLLLESGAREAEPSEAELRAFLADHADRFVRPERVRIRHVFFSHARRGAKAEYDARALLGSCRRVGAAPQPGVGNSDGGRCPPDNAPEPGLAGDPCVWPAELPLQTVDELEKIFGSAAAAVVAGPLREWSGPYRSAYGAHLVWLHERLPAAMPVFGSVRSAVRLALLHERGESLVREATATLRQRDVVR